MMRRSPRPLLGADGCRAGWVYVLEDARGVRAGVARSFADLVAVAPSALVAIDVPIGLPDAGARAADRAARAFLGRPRGSSVFPAPVRSVLEAVDYPEACALHVAADGRKLSRQAYGILHKIQEVDAGLRADPALLERVVEVHPEVSFALWNGGTPMAARKVRVAGRDARLRLVDAAWPGAYAAAVAALPRRIAELQGRPYAPDDLIDAFAALWSARRVAADHAVRFPDGPAPRDGAGIPARIWG
jgi:predicted RNase H-like nuclease